MYSRRDMPDMKEYSGRCVHSTYRSTSPTNLSDVRHTGQRPTRTTPKMECAGRMRNDSCHAGGRCAWHTHLFRARWLLSAVSQEERSLLSCFHDPITSISIFCSCSSQKMANAPAQPPLPALMLASHSTKARNVKCITKFDHTARAMVGCSRLLAVRLYTSQFQYVFS